MYIELLIYSTSILKCTWFCLWQIQTNICLQTLYHSWSIHSQFVIELSQQLEEVLFFTLSYKSRRNAIKRNKMSWPSWNWWSWCFNSGLLIKYRMFSTAQSPHFLFLHVSRQCLHNCCLWAELCSPLFSFRLPGPATQLSSFGRAHSWLPPRYLCQLISWVGLFWY